MRCVGGALVLMAVGVGACASSPQTHDAATPEETLCFDALMHMADLVDHEGQAGLDAKEKADLREGCRAPEAKSPQQQMQFRCSLEAKDMAALIACKQAADAMNPKPN